MKKILSAMIVIVMLFAVIPYSGVTKASAMETVAGSYDYLVNYIKHNGKPYNSDDMELFRAYESESVSYYESIIYVEDSDYIMFMLMIETENNAFSVASMNIKKNSNTYLSIGRYNASGSQDSAVSTINPKTYRKGTSLSYSFTETSYYGTMYRSDLCELYDSSIYFALLEWEEMLENNAGITLGNFGFTNLFKSVAIPEDVTLDNHSLSLNYKDSAKINASNGNVEWTSSNTSVATVDSNGNVNAVGRGTAKITATIKGTNVSDSCTVTVSYTWWQWIIKTILLGFLWY